MNAEKNLVTKIKKIAVKEVEIGAADSVLEKGYNIDDSFNEKVDAVKKTFFKLWDDNFSCVALVSYGKDSSCLLTMFLNAAKEYKESGKELPVSAVLTSNTKLENPVIENYVKFSIDQEGCEMFFDYELENALERYHGDDDFSPSEICPTSSFHYLIRLGVVNIHKGGHSGVDRMLRIGNQIWRSGIRDVLNDPEKLIARLRAYHNEQKEKDLKLCDEYKNNDKRHWVEILIQQVINYSVLENAMKKAA